MFEDNIPQSIFFMLRTAGFFEIMLLLIGRRMRFRVEGNSMSPVLKNGDIVLIKPQTKLKQGDIVLASHPYKKNVKILKRIKEFNENGDLFLVGDNADESTDSRTFGAVPLKNVTGKAACRLR